ncbi:M20/M25/M40 family metallo-hydrolase [Tumebacillus permanentifrigoris]|uniref:Arginine utilization protein RocB n=1 Tax=Tumebacillus permanentifrigoris TaxID=378543 RepID=A0A316D855_9BACL|nr:M20/M25/M40 family metallo-hydrolase [Tumebacillus permanentifrigoris]PWK13023.1 arginine utilization protein RocB [Tumebacillus permanentifrigoris]
MTEKWTSSEGMRQLLGELIAIPSVTGSPAEVELAKTVVEKLQELPYFQAHPDQTTLHPTGDGRFFVTALVKKAPETRKTVVLVSHFDVVDVQDFGEWKGQAFAAEALTKQFYAQKDSLPAPVQLDMANGEWLFGRGSMDMKCGLTMHMALIERACHGEFEGNLLLLTVPDEEVNSVGMRAAVPKLLELAETYGLDYQVVLNSEPMFNTEPGDDRKFVYTGSIGKILPGFFCVGKETHVGEPLSGLNANLMTSFVTCEMELATEFCQRYGNEVTPPPTALVQKDLKTEYNVQVSHRGVALYNLFVLNQPLDELVQTLRQTAERAAEKIAAQHAARSRAYAEVTGTEAHAFTVQVLTFAELIEQAVRLHGRERVEAVQARVFGREQRTDDRTATIELVDAIAELCRSAGPMIVLFFAPPFYPAVNASEHPRIQRVLPELLSFAQREYGVEFETINYFAGISDLSYVGLQYPMESLAGLVANMPLWERGYTLPLPELQALDVPVLNLGPIGRDAHKWTERLETEFAFETLPALLRQTVHLLLQE